MPTRRHYVLYRQWNDVIARAVWWKSYFKKWFCELSKILWIETVWTLPNGLCVVRRSTVTNLRRTKCLRINISKFNRTVYSSKCQQSRAANLAHIIFKLQLLLVGFSNKYKTFCPFNNVLINFTNIKHELDRPMYQQIKRATQLKSALGVEM